MIKKISKKLVGEKFLIRLNSWIRRSSGLHYRRSYSQCGEDLIARTIFDMIGICSPSYLDIGAHHPLYLNNTYIFYRDGSRGINVEPDPTLCSKFKSIRRNDINLNVGVGKEVGSLDLHIMSSRTLNTFSDAEAAEYESQGFTVEKKISVPIMTINQILSQFSKRSPDLLSIDVEGMDYEILSSLDFSQYRPVVICVETIIFSNTGVGSKRREIEDLILSNGYFRFADTYINTIYVDIEKWSQRS